MIIGVDCGHTVHGSIGSGAVGYLNESDETRRVGRSLMTLLRRAGHTVIDCTCDYASSVSESLGKIVQKANAQGLDLFVSIHFNSGGGKGCEVYTAGAADFPQAKATCMNLSALGFKNRGVKDGSHLYVIRHTTARAMLVEVCFVDSREDERTYNSVGCDRVAQAVCAAVCGDEKFGAEGDLSVTQYEELKEEIRAIKPMVYDYVDDNMPAWAKPTVQKLTQRGALVGDEHGRLRLTDDMLRILVMLDRLGLLG